MHLLEVNFFYSDLEKIFNKVNSGSGDKLKKWFAKINENSLSITGLTRNIAAHYADYFSCDVPISIIESYQHANTQRINRYLTIIQKDILFIKLL